MVNLINCGIYDFQCQEITTMLKISKGYEYLENRILTAQFFNCDRRDRNQHTELIIDDVKFSDIRKEFLTINIFF